MKKPTTKCLFAGSFDPFTLGHGALVYEASRMFDEVDVVIAVNPAKKYLLGAQRQPLVEAVIASMGIKGTPVRVHSMEGRFLAHFARELGSTHRLCGLRDSVDFVYEEKASAFNHKLYPQLQTVYLTLPGMADVSSSAVKEAFGLEGWEDVVAPSVHPLVLDALRRRHLANSQLQQAA
jgi:pantetheine-phosphate adenylyltransferase